MSYNQNQDVGDMDRWLEAFAIYRNPRILGILCLSFSSGLPFLLTLGTLQAWLKEVGISNTVLGLFSLTTVPYAFKFLWAPIIDYVHIPKLTSILGKRRSWIFVSQAALMLSLIGLGLTNPAENIYLTAFMCLLVCICAASQDNGIEAYRVEILNFEKSGAGAGASVIGFRVGMWVSGGGALYLAAHISWTLVYLIMGGFIFVGMVATLVVEEPKSRANVLKKKPAAQNTWHQLRFGYLNILKPAYASLFQHKQLYIILLFILLFKLGDTVLNMMSIPFLLEIGFAKTEIAHIAKSFGICAMIVGGFTGGILLQRYSMIQNIILSLGMLIISCLMFAIQAKVGHNVGFLVLTMGIENLACGISAATLITFLSRLCLPPFTATHFALLSSFSSMARVSLSTLSGWLADQLPWETFFIYVAIGCLPAMLVVFLQKHVFQPAEQTVV